MGSPARSRTAEARAALGCLAVLGVLAPITLFAPRPVAAFAADAIALAVGAVASTLALSTARRARGRLRQSWALIGLAILSNVAGDVTWALLDAALPEVPFPSAADAFYLAVYPLFMAGALRMPAAPTTPRERVRLALDLAVVATGASMVVWYVIVRPTAAEHGASVLGQIVAAAPPIGDVVLLVTMGVLLLRRPVAGTRRAVLLLASGIACQVAADLYYAYGALRGSYASGDPIDCLWVLAVAFFALGAASERSESDDARWSPRRIGTSLPYLGIVLGFGMLARVAWESNPDGNLSTVAGAALLCALVIARQVIAVRDIESLTDALEHQNAELREERERSERLLLNILPATIAARLKDGTTRLVADDYAEATVLFADLVGFTSLSARTPPSELVTILNDVFSRFDHLADRHGLEKIKTIGDAYMAAAGVPEPRDDHASAAAEMALDMVAEVEAVNRARDLALEVRIGIHSGPLVAGVIGERKFIYDLWGDTVNVASRMESHGVAGAVQITDAVRERLAGEYDVEARGGLAVKGRGTMKTWFLRGRRHTTGRDRADADPSDAAEGDAAEGGAAGVRAEPAA